VYLLAFTGPAPRSDVDYVWYHEQANEIETTDYLIGYHADAPISAAKLFVKPAIGGTNVSVADRRRCASRRSVLEPDAPGAQRKRFPRRGARLHRRPVRIIRRTKNWNRLVWKIPTPSVELTSVYWKTGMEFPLTIDLPFKISTFFRRAGMRIYIDTPPQVTGRRYYNDHNLQGVDIDGVMSEAELSLNPRLSTGRWWPVHAPSIRKDGSRATCTTRRKSRRVWCCITMTMSVCSIRRSVTRVVTGVWASNSSTWTNCRPASSRFSSKCTRS
jgi:hypothetical protein